jgi:hypothetical protein
MRRRALFGVLLLGLAACDNPLGASDARCDLRPKEPQCTDWRGTNPSERPTMQATCSTLTAAKGAGSFQDDGPCDTKGSLGGCQRTFGSGTKQTNGYFPSDKYKTADDAKKECSSQTFVLP